MSKVKHLMGDKIFYKKMFILAFPIMMQSLITSSLNMVDTMMIGRVGVLEVAAVGLANQYFFLFNLILFGLNSGMVVFSSQFWGVRDIKNIRKVVGLGIAAGLAIAFIFTFGALIFPDKILNVFTNDPKVIAKGSDFLTIICLGMPFMAISTTYAFSMRSIERAVIPMFISGSALAVNTMLNFTLIFGNFGAPAMGIKGTAIATFIARVFEASVMVLYIYKTKSHLAARIKELFGYNREFVVKTMKTVLPVILNEGSWALGMLAYNTAYGRIGTSSFASVQISNTISQLFLVFSIGISNACAVMIGNKIGAGEENEGKLYALRFSILSVVIGIITALMMAASSSFVVSLFGVPGKVAGDAVTILLITALIWPVRLYNVILVVGILRGGGDTTYSFLIEASTVWLVGVPLAFIGTFVLKFPIYGVVALVTAEEITKFALGLQRMLSNKWINNVIHQLT